MRYETRPAELLGCRVLGCRLSFRIERLSQADARWAQARIAESDAISYRTIRTLRSYRRVITVRQEYGGLIAFLALNDLGGTWVEIVPPIIDRNYEGEIIKLCNEEKISLMTQMIRIAVKELRGRRVFWISRDYEFIRVAMREIPGCQSAELLFCLNPWLRRLATISLPVIALYQLRRFLFVKPPRNEADRTRLDDSYRFGTCELKNARSP